MYDTEGGKGGIDFVPVLRFGLANSRSSDGGQWHGFDKYFHAESKSQIVDGVVDGGR